MRRPSGFTLHELAVAIAVAGILSGMALPSFSGLLARNVATSDANALLSAILLARNEAIRRNAPVVLCRSRNGTTCYDGRGAGWEDGLLIFADDGRDSRQRPGPVDYALRGNGLPDPGEAILRSESPFAARSHIGGGPATGRMTFDASGRPGGIASTTFTIEPQGRASAGRKLVLSATGRPRVVVP